MSETPPFADAPTNGAPTIAASRTSARRRILPVIVGVGLVLLIGFIVTQFMPRATEFYEDMGKLVMEGKIKSTETVHDGLDSAVDAFLGLFTGGNTGKMLVKV